MQPPVFATPEEYGARFTDVSFWRPYVVAICQRHHLSHDRVRAGLPGSNAVFIVDEHHAVKIYPPFFGGARSFHVERETYGLVARTLNLPAPALICHGSLFDGEEWPWPYIVTSVVPGDSVGEVELGVTERLALAAWLGPIVRRIHELPLRGTKHLLPIWDGFTAFLSQQRRRAPEQHAAWQTLPAHLRAQIDSFLPDPAALIDSGAAPVLLHGDMNRDHVFVERVGGSWRPAGIIDFGDARVGDRAYELVALHIGLFDCDKRRLALFLDRYGFDSGLRERFVFRCMSMTLLHEFDVLSEVFGRFPAAAQAASLDELATLLWDLDARGLAPSDER